MSPKKEPPRDSHHSRSGRRLQSKGDHKTAIRKFKRALIKNPDTFEVHNDIARSYHALGDFEKVEEHLKIALEKKPNHPDLHFNMGVLFMEKAKTLEASAKNDRKTNTEIKFNYASAAQYLQDAMRFSKKDSEKYNQAKARYVTSCEYINKNRKL